MGLILGSFLTSDPSSLSPDTPHLSLSLSKRLENDAKPWTILKTISLVQENTGDYSVHAYPNVGEAE